MSQVIYIVLTETGTLLSRIIKFYTQEKFSHVSIAFDSELNEMYSFGRKHESNPFIGGFVHEDPSSKLFYEANCAIYTCPVSKSQFDYLKEQIQFYKQRKEQYKYNFIGLFFVVCRLKLNRKNSFFCSQFISTLLERAGLSLEGKSPSFIIPTDLAKLPYVKLCYIGKMSCYINKHYTDTVAKKQISAIQTTA